MDKPLKGVLVVDCSSMAAAPLCARCLADWGAEVVKIEPPKGDATRVGNPMHDTRFAYYNSGKKGIVINQKTEKGAEITDRLLSKADVFLTNYRMPALKKLGLDYETLSAKFPGLIWAHLSGYGELGPDKDAPGYDTASFWARSGLMNDIVEKGQNVVLPPPAFGDTMSSSALAGGIAAALYQKAKTGKGQKIAISLYGVAVWGLSRIIEEVQDGIEYPASRRYPTIPLMTSFKCKDDKWIFIAVQDHRRYFPVIAKMIGREDMIGDPKWDTEKTTKNNADEFYDILDPAFASKTCDEWCRLLKENDVAFSVVKKCIDVVSDQQAIENGYLVDFTYPDGVKRKFTATPITFGEISHEPAPPAPFLGEHTREVLKTLGYTDEDVNSFISDGIVIQKE